MYTEKDCEPCDGSQCLIDRVVVLRQEEKSGQIFLCLGGEGSGILANIYRRSTRRSSPGR